MNLELLFPIGLGDDLQIMWIYLQNGIYSSTSDSYRLVHGW